MTAVLRAVGPVLPITTARFEWLAELVTKRFYGSTSEGRKSEV